MSLFDNNLFGFDASERGLFGLGELPSGARQLSAYATYARQLPALPAADTLRSKGATHFTLDQSGYPQLVFSFYDESGNLVGRNTVSGGSQAVEPDLTKEGGAAPPAAYREGDGLLPGSSAQSAPSRTPTWLPMVLIGGGVLVAGGIVYAATRPKRVSANRRRRRRRRSRRTSR